MKHARSRGFTMIEIILVIVIGVVLVASGTVMYRQYRQSVGDAAAFDRVNALQNVVESTYAQMQSMPGVTTTGTYPPLSTVASAWQLKRPQDYANSPWGGIAGAGVGGVSQASSMAGGIANGAVPPPNTGDNGILYYWRATNPNTYVSASDSAGGQTTSVAFYNYIVTIVSNLPVNGAPAYVFVRSGQSAPPNWSQIQGVGASGGASPPGYLF
jgi:prepilin-type N-terminal cleavage/methylation domain-containing protein